MDTTAATDVVTQDEVESVVTETSTDEVVEVIIDEEQEGAKLSSEALHQRWQSRRPILTHLQSGTATTDVDGVPMTVPLFDVGDRIVVDVTTSYLKDCPWLHTIVGRVRSIDDDTGVVSLLDEDSDPRCPGVRYASFKDGMHDFRLVPFKGDPFNVSVAAIRAAKKAAQIAANPNAEKPRGRGRPKGVKNRSKEEIAAAKEAIRLARDAKRNRRSR